MTNPTPGEQLGWIEYEAFVDRVGKSRIRLSIPQNSGPELTINFPAPIEVIRSVARFLDGMVKVRVIFYAGGEVKPNHRLVGEEGPTVAQEIIQGLQELADSLEDKGTPHEGIHDPETCDCPICQAIRGSTAPPDSNNVTDDTWVP